MTEEVVANEEAKAASNGTEETSSSAEEPKWWVDEGIPGVGDRPEWLSSKFKTAADLATSYSELEKRVGSAPDDYDLSKAELIDPDYGPFQDLKEFAKSKAVSQEVMDKILGTVDQYMKEFTVDFNEEKKKLGENAKERVNVLNNWAKSNLSKDSFTALTSSLRTADGIKALEEIRNKMMENNTTIPSGNDDSSGNAYSLEEIQEEISTNFEKYKTDPKYRKELEVKMQRVAGKTDYVDKTAS